jgi:hypothetical protein
MVLEAPAVGARYRKLSTGRVWNIHRLCDSGLIGLTEDFYGADCDVRDYVSLEELAQDYAPA